MKRNLLFTALLALSINAIAQIPQNGLVANYQFNGNVIDASGNGNNGTVNGATLTTDRLGNANSAYSFNGSTDYIDIPHSSSLTFTANAISISFWAKIISVPGSGFNGIIVSKQSGSGASQSGIDVFDNTSQTVGLRAGTSGGTYAGGSMPSVSLNQYHHFVLIYDNGTSASYLDGVQTMNSSGGTATIGANTLDLLIGKANWSNINAVNFNGVIDEMQIYNRALTSTEVTQIFSGTCGSIDITTGLVASYDFNGNANDLSSNGNNGTINGATLTTDRFGNANSAYLFNGSSSYIDVMNSSSLNFSNNISFSISSWIKLSGSNSNYSGIVSKMDNSGNGYQFIVGNNSVLNKLATEFGQGGTGVSLEGNQNLNDGNWHNVIFIADRIANTISFYVDNNLDIQTTSANVSLANIDNTFNLKIGVDRTLAYYFNGKMDDIKIYNKALTTCEIDSLYIMPNPCTGVSASVTASGATTFCQGESVILTASAATSYLWSNNATTQSITVSVASTNIVTTINSNGCSATSTPNIVTVNPKPSVITTNPPAVCAPATVDITLPAITTGSTVGLAYSYFTNAGATTPYITPTAATTGIYYLVGATSNSCSDTAALSVTVNPLPSVSVNAIPNFVNINSLPLVLNGTPTGGTFAGNGVSGNTFTPSIAGLGTSHITYNFTDNNTCNNSSVASTIVYDTTGTVCTSYDTTLVSVTDTLIINAVLTGINPPNNINTVKVYPNPANTHIYIDNGNYNLMSGYTVKITNSLSQTVFQSAINQQQFYVDLSGWTGNGIYFVNIIDGQGNIIDIRKIVLQ